MCVQGDLLVALGQGSRLLESINEPVVRDPDHNMNQDELENLATVQRSEQRPSIRVHQVLIPSETRITDKNMHFI